MCSTSRDRNRSERRIPTSAPASTSRTTATTLSSALKLEVDEYIAYRWRKEEQHQGDVTVNRGPDAPVDANQTQQILPALEPEFINHQRTGKKQDHGKG